MIDYRLIGFRVKAARNKAHMTQEELSDRIGVTIVYLSKIENGRVHPSLEMLDRICTELECDVGELFGNISFESESYRNERVDKLFASCKPEIKAILIDLMDKLSKVE